MQHATAAAHITYMSKSIHISFHFMNISEPSNLCN